MSSAVREWASAAERSGAHKRSEQCGASERVSSSSERASGWANGPVLYASISYHFKPLWNGVPFWAKARRMWHQRIVSRSLMPKLRRKEFRQDGPMYWLGTRRIRLTPEKHITDWITVMQRNAGYRWIWSSACGFSGVEIMNESGQFWALWLPEITF